MGEKMLNVIYELTISRRTHGTLIQCFEDDFEWVEVYSSALSMLSKAMITTLYNDMMHSVDSDCLVYKK